MSIFGSSRKDTLVIDKDHFFVLFAIFIKLVLFPVLSYDTLLLLIKKYPKPLQNLSTKPI